MLTDGRQRSSDEATAAAELVVRDIEGVHLHQSLADLSTAAKCPEDYLRQPPIADFASPTASSARLLQQCCTGPAFYPMYPSRRLHRDCFDLIAANSPAQQHGGCVD